MEFSSPIRQNPTSFIAPVQTTKYLEIVYSSTVSGSHTTPPLDRIEVKQYISEMAVLYEAYSMKWFNKKVQPFFFIKNTAHKWNHLNAQPPTGQTPIRIHQVWRPETIVIQPSLFEIQWALHEAEFDSHVSGITQQSEEIPYGDNQIQFVLKETLRSKMHRKIRRAKMIAAVADLNVKKLVLKYYKLYGENIINDNVSPLSSDTEEEAGEG
jgi:hypothetical protein